MTLAEIALEINTLFHDYGLDHDVVQVSHVVGMPDRLVFINAADPDAMELLLVTVKYIFGEYFTIYPRDPQGRLF